MKLDGIHQVVLRTGNLPQTIAFYQDTFRFMPRTITRNDDDPTSKECSLRITATTFLTFIEDTHGTHTEHLRKGELHSIAFRVKNLATLEHMRAHLIRKQIAASPVSTRASIHSFYLFDPNGILLEINAPKQNRAH